MESWKQSRLDPPTIPCSMSICVCPIVILCSFKGSGGANVLKGKGKHTARRLKFFKSLIKIGLLQTYFNGILSTLAFVVAPYSSRYYFSVLSQIPGFNNTFVYLGVCIYECGKNLIVSHTHAYPAVISAMYFYKTATILSTLT